MRLRRALRRRAEEEAPLPLFPLPPSTASSTPSSTTPAATTSTSILYLEEQITVLQAQLAALKAQLSSSSVPPLLTAFTRDLSLWSQGSDVTSLQKFLIGEESRPCGENPQSPWGDADLRPSHPTPHLLNFKPLQVLRLQAVTSALSRGRGSQITNNIRVDPGRIGLPPQQCECRQVLERVLH